MTRIKISENFYLDEFIHPEIYKTFKGNSKLYLSPNLVFLVQAIRTKYGKPIFINTWANGGVLRNSGLRDYKNPLGGKLNRSRHYYGLCADLHCDDIKELQKHVNDNLEYYHKLGLRVVENFNYTPTWLHVSVEWTGKESVKFINP
jgi:hypothetical protein